MATETRGTPATQRGKSGSGKSRSPVSLARRIALFYRQVIAELRKVIRPTRRELITYTTVALVFVLVMIGIVSALDFLFTQGVLRVFG